MSGADMTIRPSFSPALKLTLAVGLFAASTVALVGCHRGYYRRQADAEAYSLIHQKLNDPRWNQLDPSIETQHDSRMHDPFSADHPPMPQDDRASHELMHCVDGKPGYQHWHVNGDVTTAASPDWRGYLPLDERGILVLDMETAVQLSLIHSPDLQRQRETLYLSALDVSLERFGFDTQSFYGWSTFFRTQGREAPGGASTSIDLTPGPTQTRLQKLGISGASLAVGIANTVIWNFAGNNTQTASTLIDFSLIQPLLRGAGRQVVLESLTQAERTLLANVRQLERFRRGFYLNVSTGRNAGAGPGGNFLNEPAGGNANAGGFLGLLQTQQQIRISEFNVRSLENVLEQFREYFREQRINLLQVRQAEQTLYNAQESLLRQKVQYENELDQFKRTMGLPPDLQIEIQDPFLQQFELIDDTLLERQLEVNSLREVIGGVLRQINPNGENGQFNEDEELEWTDELEQSVRKLVPVLRMFEPYFEKVEGPDSELVEGDFAKLESVTIRRRQELEELRTFIEQSEIDYEIEPTILQPESVESADQLRAELTELKNKINLIRGQVVTLIANIDKLANEASDLTSDELKQRLETDIIYEAPEIQTKLVDAVIELTLLQARARTNAISLPEVDLDSRTATTIACQFRRDLMNARAALVDQWRQIELAADDLESGLDVVFDGSVGSSTDNPFRINWNTNQFGVGLRFDAPLTRYTERNLYRNTLINYQQARRDFYNFEDAISQNLRTTIRSLEQNKVLFELNRRGISSAIQQVELAQFDLKKPVQPGTGGRSSLGPTAANDLTRALNDLQQAQNSFLSVWVNYEVLRRGLDFDLGTMQLSPEGYWLDPGVIDAMYAYRAAEAFGIPADSVCIPPEITFDESGIAPQFESPLVPSTGGDTAPGDAPDNGQGGNPALDSLDGQSNSSRSGLFAPIWNRIRLGAKPEDNRASPY